ncbi:hypothetical protein GCM10010191_65430 [Actinomadura vinacea]|uniref:FAD:protein FMN transferase n=1 Tax=Actinomadura vinacea TaxID=115336 RepID=A0ABN3JU38_9ACTN
MTYGRERFPLWGGVATVMVERLDRLGVARRAVDHVVADINAACGVLRGDSDLARVNAAAGRPVRVGATFQAVLWTALHASELTRGLVDPLVGTPRDGSSRTILIDEPPGTVRIPAGTTLDLWGIGTAFAADRAAEAAAGQAGCGVCVSFPGAIAVAGPIPDAGWPARVANGHEGQRGESFQGRDIVLRAPGGLATSSLALPVRTAEDGRVLPQPLDPRSIVGAHRPWRLVSVIALGCVAAQTASVVALASGYDAAAWLGSRELRARMVHTDGSVATVGNWPDGRDPVAVSHGARWREPVPHPSDPR